MAMRCPDCSEGLELVGKPERRWLTYHCGRCDKEWVYDPQRKELVRNVVRTRVDELVIVVFLALAAGLYPLYVLSPLNVKYLIVALIPALVVVAFVILGVTSLLVLTKVRSRRRKKVAA